MRSPMTTLASALLITSLAMPFAGCRRDEAPDTDSSVTQDSGATNQYGSGSGTGTGTGTTGSGSDTNVGVGVGATGGATDSYGNTGGMTGTEGATTGDPLGANRDSQGMTDGTGMGTGTGTGTGTDNTGTGAGGTSGGGTQ